MNSTADDIDRLLPQTQCERCGYAGCRPYAEAIAGGRADINRCPPGGDAVIAALAELLGREPRPLDKECGAPMEPAVAVIDEAVCIGCTRCIQACPVDAIVGAAKQMHTVIASECSGCELCLPPCPVDCIDMVPHRRTVPTDDDRLSANDVEPIRTRHVSAADRDAADRFRRRFDARGRRLGAEREAREARRRERRAARDQTTRRAEIAAMVAAVRTRRKRT